MHCVKIFEDHILTNGENLSKKLILTQGSNNHPPGFDLGYDPSAVANMILKAWSEYTGR